MKRKVTKKTSKKGIFLKKFNDSKQVYSKEFKVEKLTIKVKFLMDWKSGNYYCQYDDTKMRKLGLQKHAILENRLDNKIADFLGYNKMILVEEI